MKANRSIYLRVAIISVLLIFSTHSIAQQSEDNAFTIELPSLVVSNISTDIFIAPKDTVDAAILNTITVTINGEKKDTKIANGKAFITHTFKGQSNISANINSIAVSKEITPIPLWFSILPPLIAIVIALVFKEVFTALLIGIFFGSFIISYYQGNSFFEAIVYGFFNIISKYIHEALNNPDHLAIIVFSILIGGVVTLITKNGGMKGVVNFLKKYSTGPTSGQFVTWLLGIAIFFDDYANTLVVGNTMRPITDKLKISREKLSYIVDSTAAPIASIAFVTTWIGAELGYIQDALSYLQLDKSAYHVFIHSLQFSFYPVLAMVFILFIIFRKKDFGPMYHAEINARQQSHKHLVNPPLENLENVEGQKQRWYNAVVPIVVIVFTVLGGLIITGLANTQWDSDRSFAQNLSNILGSSDSYKALLWGSFAGVFVAILLTLSQKILSLKESLEAVIEGFKSMITAIVILILAWSIALLTKQMHTAAFFSQLLLHINISPFLIPALTFLLAGFIAFSTGSSWGTMAILYPLILPASWMIGTEYGLLHDQNFLIFYNVVSSVLAGSVLGDHCSPISDTTILSSLASDCKHIDHVRTQLPYALTVGVVGLLFGTIPAAYGVPSIILFPLTMIILYLIVNIFGKKTDLINKHVDI